MGYATLECIFLCFFCGYALGKVRQFFFSATATNNDNEFAWYKFRVFYLLLIVRNDWKEKMHRISRDLKNENREKPEIISSLSSSPYKQIAEGSRKEN